MFILGWAFRNHAPKCQVFSASNSGLKKMHIFDNFILHFFNVFFGKCAFDDIPPDYPLWPAKNVSSNAQSLGIFPNVFAFLLKSPKKLHFDHFLLFLKIKDILGRQISQKCRKNFFFPPKKIYNLFGPILLRKMTSFWHLFWGRKPL